MADVCHYSDNFNLTRVVPGNGEALPERIVGAEQRSCGSAIQDADVRSGEAILISEIPAHQHRNAHGPEVIRHHDRDITRGTAGARWLWQVRAVVPRAGIDASHWRDTDGTCGNDLLQSPQAAQNIIDDLRLRCRFAG